MCKIGHHFPQAEEAMQAPLAIENNCSPLFILYQVQSTKIVLIVIWFQFLKGICEMSSALSSILGQWLSVMLSYIFEPEN